MSDDLGPIIPRRFTGDERLPMGATLLDCWQWVGSDLVSNTLRGSLSEYLVALAVGAADGVREEWAKYDVETPDGITIEVKTDSYIQGWAQKSLSTPRFSIGRSLEWSRETGEYSSTPTRSSDIYVFCLHHHETQSTVDPLDITQWTFYIVPTATLDRELGERKSIGISLLKKIGAEEVSFDDIGRRVRKLHGETKAGPTA